MSLLCVHAHAKVHCDWKTACRNWFSSTRWVPEIKLRLKLGRESLSHPCSAVSWPSLSSSHALSLTTVTTILCCSQIFSSWNFVSLDLYLQSPSSAQPQVTTVWFSVCMNLIILRSAYELDRVVPVLLISLNCRAKTSSFLELIDSTVTCSSFSLPICPVSSLTFALMARRLDFRMGTR